MHRRTSDQKKNQNPTKTGRAERQYQSQLTKVARFVGDIINGFPPDDPSVVPAMTNTLQRYSELLHDWAISTASRMIAEVNHQDKKAWITRTQDMSVALRNEILNAPTGQAMRGLLADQVTLIKSIPLKAAQRVHDLTLEGIEDATRSDEIAKKIMASGDVAESRAKMIARTEVSRTASVLLEARARSVGSKGYIWRTSEDADVRDSHKKMNGEFVSWDAPPTLDKLTGHAGCLPYCRCYEDPVIPE